MTRRPPTIRATARSVAAAAISDHARRYPSLRLGRLDSSDLPPRDAALAHAIHDGVLRRWLTLEAVLNPHLKRPFRTLEPAMKAVLLTGAAQIILFDRVPNHAAINEAVELAKIAIRPGAGGLVNAVLRKVASLETEEHRDVWTGLQDELPLGDGSAMVLSRPVLPEDELERLSAATSHPAWLLRRWIDHGSEDEARTTALHGLMDAPVILHTEFAKTKTDWRRPHEVPGHHVFEGSREGLIDLLDRHRDIWVQDPASSGAVSLAADLEPTCVVDLCAGQGTKTRHLAATFPNAEIIATDVDDRRFETLSATFEDDDRVRVVAYEKLKNQCRGRADLLLLDVPCTNTGVFARRLEARYRCDQAQLDRLCSIQRQIVSGAMALRAPEGCVLLSTCSLEAEENEGLAAWLCEEHDLSIRAERRTLPAPRPITPETAVAERYTDGAYACVAG